MGAAIAVHLTQLKFFLPMLFLGPAPDYFISALNNGLNLSFTVLHLPLIFTSLWDTKAFVALSCWEKKKKNQGTWDE